LPALYELGVNYRNELLAKHKQNPETKGAASKLLMASCISDYGIFDHLSEKDQIPSENDYIFHLSFGLLKECCLHEKIPPIIPRMLLNNIAIKISNGELEMEIPRH
jgi:hypothetical protein